VLVLHVTPSLPTLSSLTPDNRKVGCETGNVTQEHKERHTTLRSKMDLREEKKKLERNEEKNLLFFRPRDSNKR